MVNYTNLSWQIEKQLPAELVHFVQAAGEMAHHQRQGLYLVGGGVRDLLLQRTNLDIDLVVAGDAIELAQRLAQVYPGKITTHPRFNTAKLQRAEWSVDLTTTRSETYARPGALPTVKPGSLESDLFRRDFTINSMAVSLNPDRYGELVDLYGGRCDLEHKLIRVLHEKSFVDDATRIWRGLRYEQRLEFQVEETTIRLLKRDISMLDAISGDRIRHEIELILKEESPEKVLRRAEELGVLKRLHLSLKGNGWLAEKFGQARDLSHPSPPAAGLYLALLAYPLTDDEIEQLIARLRLSRSLAQILRDTASIKAKLQTLAVPTLPPSCIYRFLHGYAPTAITANSLASKSPAARQHIQLFLERIRYTKPNLTGDDLQRMGVAPGPRIKEMLQLLHKAKLDGKVRNKNDEVGLVRETNKLQ